MTARIILASLIILLTGCATAPRTSGTVSPKLLIDLETRRAVFPDRQIQLVECSDRDFHCLEAPGEFLLAFPSHCALASDNPFKGWEVAGYRFRATAPTPHLGMPNGGYFSEKYPHVHLGYRVGMGFVTLTRTRSTPYDSEWNPGDYSEEYQVEYVGHGSPFSCA